MRELLSDLIVSQASRDPNTIVLSGDHGYALFDGIRSAHPSQFINVGVMEQGMVGFAAGLAKTGHKPIVYGLAAFVPVRVLEQIKLDVCYSNLPIIFLGDGAGLVYSTLGSSHQCGEDIACLRPLPNIRVYTPADSRELDLCFKEAADGSGPAYIRIGKSDRPAVEGGAPTTTAPYFSTTCMPTRTAGPNAAIVSMSSMTSLGHAIAKELGIANLAVMRVKPWHDALVASLRGFDRLIVIEEHSRWGGLASTVADAFAEAGVTLPRMKALTLQEKFAEKCGSWQYALSEHDLDDGQVRRRVRQALEL